MLVGSLGNFSIPEFLSGQYTGADDARSSYATLANLFANGR